MSSYKDLLQETFENKFSIDKYKEFIVQFFNNTKIIDKRYEDYWNWSEYSYYIKEYTHLADYVDPDGKRIAIFAVMLKKDRSLEKARNKQRNFIADRIKQKNYDGAITAFYSENENEQKWRLSFVRLDYEFIKGKVKATFTPAKRYSYLVGKGEPCHTAMEQLFPILQDEKFNPSLDKIEEAFSVEKVTKQFFEKYREKYFELKDFLSTNQIFTEEAQRCIKTEVYDDLEKFTEQFAKKLMGQIAFMYFLQKKGWLGVKAILQTINEKQYKDLQYNNAQTKKFYDKLYVKVNDNEYKLNKAFLDTLSEDEETAVAGVINTSKMPEYAWGTGPKDFVRKLFDVAVKSNSNYFNDYLEPLFYEALNAKRSANNYFAKLHCRIPFLNGGLFEPNYDWLHTNFQIPNSIFSNKDIKGERDADGILDIFDRYNFTINEDEPLEKEVAVDPEMLGKIFENLLDAKDRKSKGAFYTPREIVHYMCQESLINYLVNSCNLPYDDTKDFILYGDIMKEEDCSREKKQGIGHMLIPETIFNKLQQIDEALADVRVADPAVGSGAFPMGMINEIVKARDIITEYRARNIEVEGKKKGMSDQQISLLKAKEHSNRNLYTLKRDTMFNSIYAVDIEPSAVDIAKLRLWLSLVVEFDVTPDEPNPPTLPNLDCHIVCGNSLIDEFEGIKLFDESILNGTGDLISNLYKDTFNKLYDAEKNYFYAQNHDDKKMYRDEIEELKLSIIDTALSVATPEIKERFKETRKMTSKPYVLWKLEFSKVFKDKGGFDIVIGNPPYGILNKKQNQNTSIIVSDADIDYYKSSKLYEPCKGRFVNMYALFIMKALSLLNKNGNKCYIFPMAFMCDLSASNLRKYILNNHKINFIEAFPERDDVNKRVFESAKMSVCILSCSLKHKENDNFNLRIHHDKFVDTRNENTKISQSIIQMIDEANYTIPLLTIKDVKLMNKILSNSKKLNTYSKCYEGEINITFHKEYITLDNNFTPLIRGAQVQQYFIADKISQGDILYIKKDEYLHNNSAEKSTHNRYKRIVMQGITGVNEKTRLKMTIIPEGLFCANSVNYLIIDENKIYAILSLLNSKLLNWFYKKLSTNSNVNGYEIDNMPIKIDDNFIQSITPLVKLELSNSNCKKDEINNIIYKYYDLTPEEIKIVEES